MTLRAFAKAPFRSFLARLSRKRKRGKTRRGHHLVTKTQTPPRQFAKAIDLICAGCRIRTGAVAIWVAIEFGAIAGATRLLLQAASSTI